ncbi:MAG: tetratricopeptide repeat protein [Roseiflexaceae bacterium]
MDVETSFGRWLRARRRALDLTQGDLARRVGCSVVTIQKIEADERRPSRQIAERLVDGLMVTTDQRGALIRLARAEPYQDVAPVEALEHQLPTSQRPSTNLPTPLTRLIGRKPDIAAVRNALLRGEVRLLTLLGPPGIGKTRLSIAVARDVQDAFSDGAYFVALAPIGDPALVLATIAQILGVTERADQPLIETLTVALQAKRLLLVLDNFEHLLNAAPLVVALLEACPGLKALVTSRAALRVRGERLYGVPPLLLPDLAQLPATVALARNPAVALFVERAQALLPHFRLNEQNAAMVAAICVRLEGLPLAIELAATRITLLHPAALLARLEQRLALLSDGTRDLPPRHRTLRAAIAWSYDLLDEGEQTLLARLGIFVGGCTLEAAEAVCNANDDLPLDVGEGVAALVNHSLLRREADGDGEPRFVLLETIREYALERLAERGEADAARRQHALYYLAATLRAGRADELWMKDATGQGLVVELDNLRTALSWALDQHEREIALRLSAAWFHFSRYRIHVNERRAWLEAALALGDDEDASPAARAALVDALRAAGYAANEMGDYDRAQAHFAALLALCEGLDDRVGTAFAQRLLGLVALQRGALVEAQTWVEQSLNLCQEAHDLDGITWSLYNLGHLAFVRGEPVRAEPLLAESLTRFRDQGNEFGYQRALISLGHIARTQGQLARAVSRYRESFMAWRMHPQGIPALEGLAGVVVSQGLAEQGARLFGATEALRESMGWPLPPVSRADYERDVAAVRAQLDEATFAATWAAGRALPLEQAITEALNAMSPATAHSHPPITI